MQRESDIALGDETQKTYLNAKAIQDSLDINDDLKVFLAYVDGDVDYPCHRPPARCF